MKKNIKLCKKSFESGNMYDSGSKSSIDNAKLADDFEKISILQKINRFFEINRLLNTYTIVGMALFVALSIVLGKYLAFNITSAIRISLENIPIIIASVAYGPIAGGIVAAVADLIGCILVGYSINPVITLGAIVIGVLSGVFYKIVSKITKNTIVHSIVSVLPAHIVGSVFVKTVGLYIYYRLPFFLTISTRAITYIIISFVEIFLLHIFLKGKIIRKFSDSHQK